MRKCLYCTPFKSLFQRSPQCLPYCSLMEQSLHRKVKEGVWIRSVLICIFCFSRSRGWCFYVILLSAALLCLSVSFMVLSMIRKETAFMEHWILSRDPTWQSLLWETHHPSLRNLRAWYINSADWKSFLRSSKRVNISSVSFFPFWLVKLRSSTPAETDKLPLPRASAEQSHWWSIPVAG